MMFKVDLDQSMEKALEKRRSAEAARKARIFNTRQRVLGVDLEALESQVQERKHLQNIEKQRDKAYDTLRQCNDKILLLQDKEEKEKQKALHKDMAQHWATQQRVKDYGDAELKCGLTGAVNIPMPEANLGPASMQIFKGEDIGWEKVKRENQMKAERDLQAQMDEKKARQMEDKQKEMLENTTLLLQHQRAIEQATHEEECKKTARMALDSYNKALAAEQAENLEYQHRREKEEALAEILHTMTSEFMTEVAETDVGDGRLPQIFTDRWKGMSPEQLRTIYKEQEQQRLEKQRQRKAEKVETLAWDLQLLNLSRKTDEEEKRAERQRKEQTVQMDQFNVQLARQQQTHQEFLNKRVFTNKVTKDYFNQFNTSSR